MHRLVPPTRSSFEAQPLALASAAALGSKCTPGGCQGPTSCYVNPCVEPGTYQYGYGTPYECGEGCNTAYFVEVSVAQALNGCVSDAGAGTALASVPWDAGVPRTGVGDSYGVNPSCDFEQTLGGTGSGSPSDAGASDAGASAAGGSDAGARAAAEGMLASARAWRPAASRPRAGARWLRRGAQNTRCFSSTALRSSSHRLRARGAEARLGAWDRSFSRREFPERLPWGCCSTAWQLRLRANKQGYGRTRVSTAERACLR